MSTSAGASTVFNSPTCGHPRAIWAAGALLGEGLCWSPSHEAIYWVDIFGRKLMRLSIANNEKREWAFDETISAVAERASGEGLIVSLQRGVAFFDPESGSLQRLNEPESHLPDNRFNDGKCDAHGRFWTGTMDMSCKAETGSLYRVTSTGASASTERAWAANFPVVNGPAWSLDGRVIWVNDTARNAVHVADFDPDTGTLSNPRPWLRLVHGDGYPDGMTTDRDGRLWIAHWAGSCVTCHAPDDGRELARIELPTSNVTNVAFGGRDLRTLFITSAAAELPDEQRASQPLAGALFAVATDAIGLAPHRFMDLQLR